MLSTVLREVLSSICEIDGSDELCDTWSGVRT